jgi:photosystem II stability/assembly factor-like uncharacterized protein
MTLTACGGESATGDRGTTADTAVPRTATAPGPSATGLEHVHAVAVDPGDGATMLATHTGLFRLAPGADAPVRVGDARQDTMGFTITGAGRYLGSGHPAPGTDLPPLLGLIASDDGGISWSAVSLLGEADFHVLRAADARIVGVDSVTGTLFVSDDAGATWQRRTPPAAVIDLVIDPARPDTLVAATGDGMATSRDAGATWTALGGEPGYLAWPAPDMLYRAGADGAVAVSADRGRTWTPRGTIGRAPAAFSAANPTRLLAATHDGRLIESRDAGARWRTVADLG